MVKLSFNPAVTMLQKKQSPKQQAALMPQNNIQQGQTQSLPFESLKGHSLALRPVISFTSNGVREQFMKPEKMLSTKGAGVNTLYKPFSQFDKECKDIASHVSADIDMIYTYPKGSKPELVAYNFANMLSNKEFEDLNANNTEVILWDPHKQIMKNFIRPGKDAGHPRLNSQEANDMRQMYDQNPSLEFADTLKKFATEEMKIDRGNRTDTDHRVVFVKDMNWFLHELEQLKAYTQDDVPAGALFGSELMKGTTFIGFMDDGVYQENFKSTSPNNQLNATGRQWVENFDIKHVRQPNVQEAVEMVDTLLNQCQITKYEYTGQFANDVKFDKEGIEKAVKFVSNSRGTFPEDVANLLTLVAGEKVNKESSIGLVKVQSADVSQYIANHPDIKLNKIDEANSLQFKVVTSTQTSFKDVGGAEKAKEELKDLVDFLKNPEKYKEAGAQIPKGYLLHGPPGTGKTLLAEAVAGEANVPFVSVSGSEFVEMFVGVGAQRVRELFNTGEKVAISEAEKRGDNHKVAVIFIDELDSLGRARENSGASNREDDQTVSQLLTELNGFQSKDNDVSVVVIGATNRIDLIDDALRRPGRFEIPVEVGIPKKTEDRMQIIEAHARKKRFESDAQKQELIKYTAEKTDGFTGADLKAVMNKAAIYAVKEDRTTLSKQDLDKAISFFQESKKETDIKGSKESIGFIKPGFFKN